MQYASRSRCFWVINEATPLTTYCRPRFVIILLYSLLFNCKPQHDAYSDLENNDSVSSHTAAMEINSVWLSQLHLNHLCRLLIHPPSAHFYLVYYSSFLRFMVVSFDLQPCVSLGNSFSSWLHGSVSLTHWQLLMWLIGFSFVIEDSVWFYSDSVYFGHFRFSYCSVKQLCHLRFNRIDFRPAHTSIVSVHYHSIEGRSVA